MDPVTQGALGAVAAQLVLQRRLGPTTWIYGALGGMAADLDILIRSADDPLVAWTYHRHFTHSLAFVPVGGVLTSLPFLWRKAKAQRALIIAATTVGYATHALLDAFTSYGTQLWWPFANTRVAWNWIGIVDPAFTVPLCIAVVVGTKRQRLRPLWIATCWCAVYMMWGGIQHARARAHAERLAASRGHEVERIEAFPGVVTNVLWRTLYLSRGRIHIDAVRVPWWGSPSSLSGGSVEHVSPDDAAALLGGGDRMTQGLATFDWFADGWVARQPSDDGIVFGDLRYGRGLAGPEAMWGLRVQPSTEHPFSTWNSPPDEAAMRARARAWTQGFTDR